MEVSNSRQFAQQAQTQPATTAGKDVLKSNQELPTVALKAAPAVPEFEKLDLDQAIAELQEFVDGLGRSLSFSRDDFIDRSIITVRDTQSNQVVRQIPSEEVVAIARQIREDLTEIRAGLLMEKSV